MAKHNIFKNKRGANIEIGKIRPNTYNEYCGCTVDIQIFVYNRTMNRRCKFWLVDYDTSWSGDDLLSGLYESELENNENFDEDMELSDVYSDEEMEEYVWDAIMSEWEFYPDDCPFIDCINPIEDALKNEQVFKDYSDVIDPEIDALLVSPAYCWDELEEEDLIDYDAMSSDDDFSVEDFEKEDKMSETDSDKSMDEANVPLHIARSMTPDALRFRMPLVRLCARRVLSCHVQSLSNLIQHFRRQTGSRRKQQLLVC